MEKKFVIKLSVPCKGPGLNKLQPSPGQFSHHCGKPLIGTVANKNHNLLPRISGCTVPNIKEGCVTIQLHRGSGHEKCIATSAQLTILISENLQDCCWYILDLPLHPRELVYSCRRRERLTDALSGTLSWQHAVH